MFGISDPVVRLVVVNWLLGMVLGLLAAGLVFWLDLGGLRSLLLQSDFALAGFALLFVSFAATFGGLVCGTAVMMVKSDEPGCGPD